MKQALFLVTTEDQLYTFLQMYNPCLKSWYTYSFLHTGYLGVSRTLIALPGLCWHVEGERLRININMIQTHFDYQNKQEIYDEGQGRGDLIYTLFYKEPTSRPSSKSSLFVDLKSANYSTKSSLIVP